MNHRPIWEGDEGLRAQAADMGDSGAVASFRLKLNAFLSNQMVKATWKHRRPDLLDQSLAGYDVELCRLAAGAEWTDAELAELIRAHHEAYGSAKEGRRADYVARTIASARSQQDDAAARPNGAAGPQQQTADGQDHGARAGDAAEQANGEPHGGHAGDAGGDQQARDGAADTAAAAGSARTKQGTDATAPRLSPAAPLASAREFVRLRFTAAGMRTIHHRGGLFHTWNGTCYPSADDATIRARIYEFLDTATQRVHDKETKEFSDVPFRPTRGKVNDVLDALKAAANLDSAIAAPAWLDDTRDLPASELIACTNGLLHLPTRNLVRHTPAFFGYNALDFAYDPDAHDPIEWLRFLESLWPDDIESIEVLQELFGYLLSTDTRQQKIFMLVGPKRSGKGTIARVLTALLGRENVCGPTLASLGQNFGISPLIGKQAAIIADARLGARADQAAVAERLLSISGEDAITVDRKFLPAWTGRLTVRFVLLSNELPRLTDASGALASRFIIWTLTRSFFGREDYTLVDRLLRELPGILNWAIEGWARLQIRGRFQQPKSALDAVAALEDLASPIGAFLRQRCRIAAGLIVACDSLFAAWKLWCTDQGRDHAGTVQTFGRDLHAALPQLKITQPRWANLKRHYEGLALGPDTQ